MGIKSLHLQGIFPVKPAREAITPTQIIPTGEGFPSFPRIHEGFLLKLRFHPDGAIWAPINVQEQAWGLENLHGNGERKRKFDATTNAGVDVYHEIMVGDALVDGRILRTGR